jgi:uncharacterized protein
MRTMEYKSAQTEVKDLDKKGRVKFYASVFGNEDYGGDVVEAGAFKKTISENYKKIRHLKYHDKNIMPGVIIKDGGLIEDNYGLLVTSDLILTTQEGHDTYEQYKAMLEADKSMDHSIGYSVIKKEQKGDVRFLKELMLMEVSTLTAWGMNKFAETVDVKSFQNLDFNQLLTEEKYYKALLNCKFTDAKLDNIQGLYDYLKSLITERAAESTQGDEPIVIKGSDYIKTLNFKF